MRIAKFVLALGMLVGSLSATTVDIIPSVVFASGTYTYSYTVSLTPDVDETGYQFTLSALTGLVPNLALVGVPVGWDVNADFSSNTLQWVSLDPSSDLSLSPVTGFSFASLVAPGLVNFSVDWITLDASNSGIVTGQTTGPFEAPEPSAAALLLGGLGWLAWRKKKQAGLAVTGLPLAGLCVAGLFAGGGELQAATAQVRILNAPSWAPNLTVKAGSNVVLDAAASAGSAPLSFSWQQISGPSTLRWLNRTTSRPTVLGTVFGTYVVRVTVSDAGGPASADLRFGAVPSDNSGVVTPFSNDWAMLFAPLPRWGTSPWPWQDEAHKALADGFINTLNNNINYSGNDWNTPLAGTVSVTFNSTIVTGTGTNFQVDFCGGAGNTTPVPGRAYMNWYPAPGGGTGRRAYAIASCNSATQLTLGTPYQTASGVASGLNYSMWNCPVCWIGQSNNVNYYDVVMGLYSLYYRTGLDEYRTQARRLADLWLRSANIDEGRMFWYGPESERAPNIPAPRLLALTGVMWYLYETGQTARWTPLYPTLDARAGYVGSSSVISDAREQAYELAFLAVASRLAPDTSRRVTYANALTAAVNNRWLPQQQGGVIVTGTFDIASWNGYPGTVSVTNGSDVVTGTGTNWQASWMTNNSFWVANSSTSGDTVAYYQPTWISPTQLKLPMPYQGATASGKLWQLSNLVGPGQQPFAMGLVGRSFDLVWRATGLPGALQMISGGAQWIQSAGIQPDTKGLYYGRIYVNCEPIVSGLPNCSYNPSTPGETQASRYLSASALAALSAAFVQGGGAGLLANADLLAGAALGKTGGLNSDGQYVDLLDTAVSNNAFKDFGYWFGFAPSTSWAAARTGTPTSLLLGR